MTKEEIIKEIWNQFPDITIAETRRIYEVTMNLIRDTLARGEAVEVRNFGKFSVREKNPRTGRNPKTGEEAVVKERKVVVFKASKNFKGQVLHTLVNYDKNIADNETSD
jgi:nucleoid DNA-binding protein